MNQQEKVKRENKESTTPKKERRPARTTRGRNTAETVK